MAELVQEPTEVIAAGNKPKVIRELVGRVNTGSEEISIALMRSPGGWVEPAQSPEFDEYTVVLKGMVRVEHEGGVLDVEAGQVAVARAGERVRYSTPKAEGAEYLAVCLPAFSPETVHREAE